MRPSDLAHFCCLYYVKPRKFFYVNNMQRNNARTMSQAICAIDLQIERACVICSNAASTNAAERTYLTRETLRLVSVGLVCKYY